jgi:hypothetical protein
VDILTLHSGGVFYLIFKMSGGYIESDFVLQIIDVGKKFLLSAHSRTIPNALLLLTSFL